VFFPRATLARNFVGAAMALDVVLNVCDVLFQVSRAEDEFFVRELFAFGEDAFCTTLA
jgi:hypothetical protein